MAYLTAPAPKQNAQTQLHMNFVRMRLNRDATVQCRNLPHVYYYYGVLMSPLKCQMAVFYLVLVNVMKIRSGAWRVSRLLYACVCVKLQVHLYDCPGFMPHFMLCFCIRHWYKISARVCLQKFSDESASAWFGIKFMQYRLVLYMYIFN